MINEDLCKFIQPPFSILSSPCPHDQTVPTKTLSPLCICFSSGPCCHGLLLSGAKDANDCLVGKHNTLGGMVGDGLANMVTFE